MMIHPARVILMSVLLVLASSAIAQNFEAKAAVSTFRERANPMVLQTLKLEAENAVMEAMLGRRGTIEAFRKKVKYTKDEIEVAFRLAKDSLAEQPKAADLLSEYYVTWLSAMDGMAVIDGESKMTYQMRFGESVRRLNDAWNRFQIEFGV